MCERGRNKTRLHLMKLKTSPAVKWQLDCGGEEEGRGQALCPRPHFSLLKNILFVWLHRVLSVAHGTFTAAHGLSSCGVGPNCPIVCGILVPRPGIEPVSPASEGRFLTTGPPEKSLQGFVSEGICHGLG